MLPFSGACSDDAVAGLPLEMFVPLTGGGTTLKDLVSMPTLPRPSKAQTYTLKTPMVAGAVTENDDAPL